MNRNKHVCNLGWNFSALKSFYWIFDFPNRFAYFSIRQTRFSALCNLFLSSLPLTINYWVIFSFLVVAGKLMIIMIKKWNWKNGQHSSSFYYLLGHETPSLTWKQKKSEENEFSILLKLQVKISSAHYWNPIGSVMMMMMPLGFALDLHEWLNNIWQPETKLV